MQVECGQCGREINLPDEKLPQALRFKFTCPSCGNKVVVERSEPVSGTEQPQEDEFSPAPEPDLPPLPAEDEYFPPGAEVLFAFVQDSRWAEAVETFAKENGLYLSRTDSAEQGVLKLRYTAYRAVVIEQGAESAELLNELGRVQGVTRRQTLCVLITPETASFDPQHAFFRGVDCCLKREEAAEAPTLLVQAYEAFLRRLEPWKAAEKQLEAAKV